MSTPIIMLTRSFDDLRTKWAHDQRATEALDSFVGLTEPGTRIWVYGQECFAATVVGLSFDFVEEMFGQVDFHRKEFIAPLIAATRDDTGELFQVGPVVAVPLAAARTAWHIVDSKDRIVAGGPNVTEDRAQEIATRYGPDFTIRRGVPASGIDTRPDDGLGVFDPKHTHTF